MSFVTQLTGGCIGFAGFFALNPLGVGAAFNRALQPIENDSSLKKVARVAAVVLNCVGTTLMAVGCIAFGVSMLTAAAPIGFFGAVLAASYVTWPFFAGGLGGLAFGALCSVGGGVPNPAPARRT